MSGAAEARPRSGPEDLAVEMHQVRVTASGGADIVDEVTLLLRPGEILGLVGESGCGKTTVGLAVLGHCRRGAHIAGGEILVAGHGVHAGDERGLRSIRGRIASYIPQDPSSALNPALRIGRQLREVLDTHLADWPADRREQRLQEVLGEVSLPGDDAFLRRYPHQLSGGQQQRVAIAMAVACRPRVVVCDEPTTGLDVTTQARVLAVVRELCRAHQIAVLYISHDLAVVASLVDRVAVMYGGRIVEEGNDLFSTPRHPYTRRLLEAVPDVEGRRQPRGIEGQAPGPGERGRGCSFAPRCTRADDQCRSAPPPVSEIAPSHRLRCYHPEAEAPLVAASRAPGPAIQDALVLRARALRADYGGSRVLHDVDLDVHSHECVALVGESGSGKTTIARCLVGLHPAFEGVVSMHGTPLAHGVRSRSREQRRALQFVFQSPYASLNPRHLIGESIAAPLRVFTDMRAPERSRRVAALLERVALPSSIARAYPDQLSGGERQRAAIARALAAEPTILVCDEITSALDVSVQATIVELLAELRAEIGLSLLFITHNLALIRTIADTIVVIYRGSIVETGPTGDVFSGPTSEYTRALLTDTPSFDFDNGSSLLRSCEKNDIN